MRGDSLSKLIAKTCFLVVLTMTILVGGNSEASLQFKQIKGNLLGEMAGR